LIPFGCRKADANLSVYLFYHTFCRKYFKQILSNYGNDP